MEDATLTNFSAKQNHSYVVVDFSNVTERGLKKLTNTLNSSGSTVIDIEANNRKTKKDGHSVKKAKFFFKNEQTMTLFIGDHGDIFQLSLNATKQPIPSVKNERELANEMIRLMDRNQAKFDKEQERKAKRKVAKDTSNHKPASRSISKRLDEAKATLNDIEANFSKLNQIRDSSQKKLNNAQKKIKELQATLKTEKQETKQLEKEIGELN